MNIDIYWIITFYVFGLLINNYFLNIIIISLVIFGILIEVFCIIFISIGLKNLKNKNNYIKIVESPKSKHMLLIYTKLFIITSILFYTDYLIIGTIYFLVRTFSIFVIRPLIDEKIKQGGA